MPGLDAIHQGTDISNTMNGNLDPSTAKDTTYPYNQMTSHPLSVSNDATPTAFQDESLPIHLNSILSEPYLKVGPQANMPLLNDQTASKEIMQLDQEPNTLPWQSRSNDANFTSSTTDKTISPFSEVPGLDVGTSIEDPYCSLWSRSGLPVQIAFTFSMNISSEIRHVLAKIACHCL